MPSIHFAASLAGAEKAVQKILRERPVIGLRCLGINIGPKGTITLVLIGTLDEEVYIFDVKEKDLLIQSGLVRLLQSPDIIKVMHDCGPEAAALHYQFGVTLDNVFDTQTAYAVLLEGRGLPPRRLPLSALCQNYVIDRYTPRADTQKLLKEDQNIWARRPLNRDLLNLAASDVIPLVPALYEYLNRVLLPESREWFEYLTTCNLNSQIKQRNPKLGRKKEGRETKSQERPVYKIAAI